MLDFSYENIRRIIAGLPIEYRLVMALSRLEGFSCEELSELADIRPDAVGLAIAQGNRLIYRALLRPRHKASV